MTKRFLLCVCFLLSFVSRYSSAQVSQIPSFTLSPQTAYQGDILIARISPYSRLPQISIWVFGEFYQPNENGLVYVGIDIETKPGKYKVCLTEGVIYWYCSEIEVKQRNFLETKFDRNRITDPAIPLIRIERERIAKNRVFANVEKYNDYAADTPYLEPLFVNRVTGEFGAKRIYKDGTTVIHLGTDLEAPVGSKVMTINSGKVAMVASNFYFDGDMVIVDHGSGIMSMYLHLSKIMVKEGDIVSIGDTIALSGDSGQVTGPHLHLFVRVNGIYVDPLKFIDIMNQLSTGVKQ